MLAALSLLAAVAIQPQALPAASCPPPAEWQRVDGDDFQQGLARWRLEAQDTRAVVQAQNGVLDIQTPAGLSLWWRQPLQGDYALRFTATALPAPATAGALAGRLSDLNMFWNATEADGSEPVTRSGAFAAYDTLRTYYLGFGANGNRTTRLRLYDGRGERQVLDGSADAPEATSADRRGAMTPATRLQAGLPVTVEIVSRQPTASDPVHLRWSSGRQMLFGQSGPQPLLRGWFALRTTASRLQLRNFEVLRCTRR